MRTVRCDRCGASLNLPAGYFPKNTPWREWRDYRAGGSVLLHACSPACLDVLERAKSI